MPGDHADHLISHTVQLVVISQIARPDDFDARARKAAFGELLGKNTRLSAGKIKESGIWIEIANTLQERGKVGIGKRNSDRLDDLTTKFGKALLECRFRFNARRPLVDQCDHAFASVFGRPFPHDPGRL